MYTIVAGVDGDESRATAQAETILDMPMDRAQMEVLLTHVFNENTTGASVAQVSSVQRAQEILEAAGVEVTLKESGSNDPAEAVDCYADMYDADLVTVAGRDRSATKKALFGSVSQELIRRTDCPVLVCD